MAEMVAENLHVARWWEMQDDGRILCTLCPRECRIGEGKIGFCFIRQNIGGTLYSLGYGQPVAIHIDPVEKKPLNHFLPGTTILSMGTAGCNLGCKFCQNWDISKAKADQFHSINLTPEAIVQAALEHGTPSIAYTYNEPTIWGEYVIDIARVGHEHGVRSVMVTNGYVTDEAFHDIYDHIDAFTEEFYKKITIAHLEPVLNILKRLKHETNVWFEITTLLIPGANDVDEEIKQLCGWILENLSDRVPLHFTAFHPDFKMTDRPRTPASTLTKARNIGLEMGLKFVYVGNVHDTEGQTTYCPACKTALIRRDWHSVLADRVVKGKCFKCGEAIAGVWE